MTTEEEKKRRNKKKKNKKQKKDKWGQPVVTTPTAAEEEEEEEGGPRDAGFLGAGPEEEEEADPTADGQPRRASYEADKVVVSGMPYSATEDDIRLFFEGLGGAVTQIQLSRFPDSGNFRGLAFVTFENDEIATSSLKLDGKKMENRFIKVERCRLDSQKSRKRKSEFLDEPKKVDGCFSAYIGNLSWDVTEDDIRDCFDTSEIVSIRFAVDKRTGTFRGFGHIDFADDESLEEAMKKNQVELLGRPLKIAYAVSSRD